MKSDTKLWLVSHVSKSMISQFMRPVAIISPVSIQGIELASGFLGKR